MYNWENVYTLYIFGAFSSFNPSVIDKFRKRNSISQPDVVCHNKTEHHSFYVLKWKIVCLSFEMMNESGKRLFLRFTKAFYVPYKTKYQIILEKKMKTVLCILSEIILFDFSLNWIFMYKNLVHIGIK